MLPAVSTACPTRTPAGVGQWSTSLRQQQSWTLSSLTGKGGGDDTAASASGPGAAGHLSDDCSGRVLSGQHHSLSPLPALLPLRTLLAPRDGRMWDNNSNKDFHSPVEAAATNDSMVEMVFQVRGCDNSLLCPLLYMRHTDGACQWCMWCGASLCPHTPYPSTAHCRPLPPAHTGHEA